MDDEDSWLLKLYPCQLADKSLETIKKAVDLGYDLSKRCDKFNCHDHYCKWINLCWYGAGLFEAMWYFHIKNKKDYFNSGNRDPVKIEKIRLLSFIYELYKGKIIFLDHQDILWEKYDNTEIYGIESDETVMPGNVFKDYDLIVYCLDNGIIDIESSYANRILEMIFEAHNYSIICDHIDNPELWENKFKDLKTKIHNIKQQNKHYSLGSLMVRSIDLEKEDLSASYYY